MFPHSQLKTFLSKNWILQWPKIRWPQIDKIEFGILFPLDSFSGGGFTFEPAKISFCQVHSCEVNRSKQHLVVQWLWLIWYSGRFLFQRPAVWIQSLAKFYIEHLLWTVHWKDENEEKERPRMANFTQQNSILSWWVGAQGPKNIFCINFMLC